MEWFWFILVYFIVTLITLYCLFFHPRVTWDALAVKSVDRIDNPTDMIRGMENPGISCEGTKTIDETKTHTEAASKTSLNKARWTAHQVRVFQTIETSS